MTVSSALSRKEYTGDAVTTSFSTSPVEFFETSNLTVYVVVTATGVAETLTEGTHYTVSGGDGATGTVNLAGGTSPYGAPAATKTVVIQRTVPRTQQTDFVQNDGSDAEVFEEALDRLVMITQEHDTTLDRVFKLADSDVSGVSLDMPTPAASELIGFNSGATALTTYPAASIAASIIPTSFAETLLDDSTAAEARTTLGLGSAAVLASSDVLLQSLADAKGDSIAATGDGVWAKETVGANGTIQMARSAATTGRAYVAALNKAIYGLTYANNGSDATNDIDIATGGAMDATGAYWMTLASALTKQSDVAWAVGTNAGWLDTGAVGNSDYYIWLIARSDTGVVDSLCSLSSTAPTMPTNYDFKRLIGWFKRVGGTIVAFTTIETEGGGIFFQWTTPTQDINLANTLTTTRRTDAVKVPLNFSVLAWLSIYIVDASAWGTWMGNPNAADVAVVVANPETGTQAGGAGAYTVRGDLKIYTNSSGLIAARADTATMDTYRVATIGFTWARRN